MTCPKGLPSIASNDNLYISHKWDIGWFAKKNIGKHYLIYINIYK